MALITAARIADDLDDAIARLMKRGDGGKTAPKSEVPLPIDMAASDAADHLRVFLFGWASVLAIKDEPWPTGIHDMALWVLTRMDRIRQHHQTPAIYPRFRPILRSALAVIDRQSERVQAGFCASCDEQLLAELGADTVTCGCGIVTTGLLAARRERAAAADVLGTATEISGALDQIGIHVPASTIRTWASRGRLAQRAGAVYAMSDVLALCAQRDARR